MIYNKIANYTYCVPTYCNHNTHNQVILKKQIPQLFIRAFSSKWALLDVQSCSQSLRSYAVCWRLF